jgi:hypothetical protein
MRQSKFHRDIPDDAHINVEYEHITMNDKDELIGCHCSIPATPDNLEHLDIDEKLKLVRDLIERKADEYEGYTELWAGLIIQKQLPDAKIVRKK